MSFAMGYAALHILGTAFMLTTFLPYVIHPILGIGALPHFTNDFMIV
jgi:hypothetical protein